MKSDFIIVTVSLQNSEYIQLHTFSKPYSSLVNKLLYKVQLAFLKVLKFCERLIFSFFTNDLPEWYLVVLCIL